MKKDNSFYYAISQIYKREEDLLFVVTTKDLSIKL